MTAQEILAELKTRGDEGYKRILAKHGVREPFFGVKISELKKIQQRIKTDYQLALDLFATGNYDAMYLAGLIADDARMTKADLQRWVKGAYGPLTDSAVPWVAAQGRYGWELGLQWIDSPKPLIAATGWSTLVNWISLKPDAELDLPVLRQLLARVKREIHAADNDVRANMNRFVIAVGSFVKPLSDQARAVGEEIGEVAVDVGDTSCVVPFAPARIDAVAKKGAIGKKRATVKC